MSTQNTNTQNMNTEDTPQKSEDRAAEALPPPAVTLDPQTMKESLETIANEAEKLLQMEMPHEVEVKVALLLAIARKPIDCRVQEETRA
ncbi:MAG: hypothetical protein ACRYFS_15160 [Janthinobacterium lividum]